MGLLFFILLKALQGFVRGLPLLPGLVGGLLVLGLLLLVVEEHLEDPLKYMRK